MGQFTELKAADGQMIPAYVAQPAGQPKGGVVVIQEIFGVNSHIRSVADGFRIVFTAPVAWASSVSRSTRGTTRSLWGIVTFAPRKSSPSRISPMESGSTSGARSQSSYAASMPTLSNAACCIAPESE